MTILKVILLIILPCNNCNVPIAYHVYDGDRLLANNYAIAEIKDNKVVDIYIYYNGERCTVLDKYIYKIYYVYDVNALPQDYKLNVYRREEII